MRKLTTIEQVKRAVDSGKSVHWSNNGYKVIRDSSGQYLIVWNHHGAGENFVGLGADYFSQDFLKDNPFYY